MVKESWWRRTVKWVKTQYGVTVRTSEPDLPANDTATLGELVTLLADRDDTASRNAFYGRLLFSKVGARLPASATSLPSGKHVTAEGDSVGIPSMRGPDGKVYLLVCCCDVPAIWAAYPDDKIFELDARVVLEMAQRSGVGVIVQNILDGKASRAAVPRKDVADVLSGRHSNIVVVE